MSLIEAIALESGAFEVDLHTRSFIASKRDRLKLFLCSGANGLHFRVMARRCRIADFLFNLILQQTTNEIADERSDLISSRN